MEIKNPQYFGQLLHKQGFDRWFLYMFRLIESRKFIRESLKEKLIHWGYTFVDMVEVEGEVSHRGDI